MGRLNFCLFLVVVCASFLCTYPVFSSASLTDNLIMALQLNTTSCMNYAGTMSFTAGANSLISVPFPNGSVAMQSDGDANKNCVAPTNIMHGSYGTFSMYANLTFIDGAMLFCSGDGSTQMYIRGTEKKITMYSGGHNMFFDGLDSQAGQWHNIIVIRNASTLDVYIDGIKNYSNTGSAGVWDFGDGSSDFVVYKYFTGAYPLKGGIGRFYWWNRTLSQSEIKLVSSGKSESFYPFVAEPILPQIARAGNLPLNATFGNVMGKSYNVTYNYTNLGAGVNQSSLYVSGGGGCWKYVNGVSTCGYENHTTYNVSSAHTFVLRDNSVFAATYNYEEEYIESAVKNQFKINGSQIARINFINVSPSQNYTYLELYANATTAAPLRIWCANSSYVTGNPLISEFAYNFINLPASMPFNHTHGANSYHLLVSVPVVDGKCGSVGITHDFSFLFAGNGWIINYISNVSRPDTFSVSTDSGASYANVSGTPDAHLHQLNRTSMLCDYADVTDSNGYAATSPYCIPIIAPFIAPTPPVIISPNGSEVAYGYPVNISFLDATEGTGGAIILYRVFMANSEGVQNVSIANVSFGVTDLLWNVTESYTGLIGITAVDTIGQETTGYSLSVVIDVNPPLITFLQPATVNGSTVPNLGSFTLELNVKDNNLLYLLNASITDNGVLKWNISEMLTLAEETKIYTVNVPDWANGSIIVSCLVCDAHTAQVIPYFAVIEESNRLTFAYEGKRYSIKSVTGFETWATATKKKDRYEIAFNYAKSSPTMLYEIETSEKVVYLPNSGYKGHFVIGDTFWLDFEGVNPVIVGYSDGKYSVMVGNSGGKSEQTFHSTGLLNCNTAALQFNLTEYVSPIYTPPAGLLNFDFSVTGNAILFFGLILLYIALFIMAFLMRAFPIWGFMFVIGLVIGLMLSSIAAILTIIFICINISLLLYGMKQKLY